MVGRAKKIKSKSEAMDLLDKITECIECEEIQLDDESAASTRINNLLSELKDSVRGKRRRLFDNVLVVLDDYLPIKEEAKLRQRVLNSVSKAKSRRKREVKSVEVRKKNYKRMLEILNVDEDDNIGFDILFSKLLDQASE